MYRNYARPERQVWHGEVRAMKQLAALAAQLALDAPQPPTAFERVAWTATGAQISSEWLRHGECLVADQDEIALGIAIGERAA